MSDTKRDAAADLAVCAAATPGPWEKMPFGGDWPGVRCIAHPRPDLAEQYPPDQWGAVFREDLICMGHAMRLVDLDFIAMARTALPHWIERATAAEAEVERLRAALAVAAQPCPLNVVYGKGGAS